MSSSMRLRRSPKPGALTATAVKVPRSLLTTIVASDSPSTSSATISSGRAGLDDLLEHGQEVLDRADLLVRDQDVRIVEHGLHALGVGDHVRRQVALVELHALGELELEAEGLALLDVHDAVLADLLDRVGDHVADLALARTRWWRPGRCPPCPRSPWTATSGRRRRSRRPSRCRASAPSGSRPRRRSSGPRGRSPARAPWRSSCRRRRRRSSRSRPRGRAARPGSRRRPRPRSRGRS